MNKYVVLRLVKKITAAAAVICVSGSCIAYSDIKDNLNQVVSYNNGIKSTYQLQTAMSPTSEISTSSVFSNVAVNSNVSSSSVSSKTTLSNTATSKVVSSTTASSKLTSSKATISKATSSKATTSKATSSKATTSKATSSKVTTSKATSSKVTTSTKSSSTSTFTKKAETNNVSSQSSVLTSTQQSMLRNRMISDINALRAKSFHSDSSLNSIAAVRSKEIVTCWSHTRPDGSRGANMIDSSKWRGENLAKVCVSSGWTGSEAQINALADRIVNDWVNSTSHHANLVNTHFTNVGIYTNSVKNGNSVTFYTACMFSN